MPSSSHLPADPYVGCNIAILHVFREQASSVLGEMRRQKSMLKI